ncbi:M23 family metallopeptidase [Fervidibacillus halotolerans]|uniref:Peptidoglycan DD-metalloendopeptidase family protein n=1 Tax=Fervidibacillus halotolerans TaxID=2980027 RepID=A0A9E8RYH8_9BACI|nr:M23 family metallopeptidase [Fervidibacillus halotolerans]WAA12258.1 peptidoglycan DD-metalloendopeptidase family protein [Fervidibacillus halotolerans]
MMNKGKRKEITFTILSNNANAVVTRFRVPKIVLYFLTALPFVPILLLVYYITISGSQQAELEKLAQKLENETAEKEQLEQIVTVLEERSGETKVYLEQLAELENRMRNYINELPSVIEPMGGTQILVDEDESVENGNVIAQSTELIERYEKTLAIVGEVSEELRYTPTAWPTVPNTITSEYGLRRDPFNYAPSFHSGIDIRGSYGTPVFATADGKVIFAEYYGGYGNTIKIKHNGTYTTLYGHLSKINVNVGDTVKKGDIIGAIGSTGRSTGPHLHYEIIKNGKTVNPKPYFMFFETNKD